jgi:hypothetical protein
MNGGKGVVGHQAHDQIEAPILFGSLTTDVLRKGMIDAKNMLPSDILQPKFIIACGCRSKQHWHTSPC